MKVCCGWLVLLSVTVGVVGADDLNSSPKAADKGFASRAESWFRAGAGKPLERAAKKPPLRKGNGNYARAYSYTIVDFAARCFHLGEMPAEANAALVENARHYLDHPKDTQSGDPL